MLKLFLCEIGYRTGLFALLRWFHWLRGKRLTILMFHRVGYAAPSGENGLPTLFITPESFEKVLAFVKKRYRVTRFAALPRFGILRDHAVILTFDDGYHDVLTHAVPILRRHGLPFTLYLPSGLLCGTVHFWWDEAYRNFYGVNPLLLFARLREDGFSQPFVEAVSQVLAAGCSRAQRAIHLTHAAADLPHEERKRLLKMLRRLNNEKKGTSDSSEKVMSAAEVNLLCMEPDVEIGSHTVNHYFLDTVDPAIAREEICQSREQLQEFSGAEVLSFAYPAGRWTPPVREMVAAAGYHFACTTREGINGPGEDPLLLRRINLSESVVTDRSGRFRPALLAARLALADFFSR